MNRGTSWMSQTSRTATSAPDTTRAGIYARVSSQRQARDQTIEQQLSVGRRRVQEQGWVLREEHISRDDGYSGASLSRPGLDRLRDDVAMAEVDVVVITAPDRLARNYLHQMVLLDESERQGVRVEFVERPMSDDPNDQLLPQIRGAVAQYERTLIAERLRRGKLAKLRAGQLCPGRVATMATGSILSARAIPLECAWTPMRLRLWRRSSPGIWRREPAFTVWGSG
jgi:predicted site-specific integrase-resolvase